MRDRNTLIAQAAVLRAEHEDTDPELHHIIQRPGGAGLGDVFTKVDSSLIDLVPIPGRDGAEC